MRRPTRNVAIVIGVLLLIAGAAGTYLVLRGDDSSTVAVEPPLAPVVEEPADTETVPADETTEATEHDEQPVEDAEPDDSTPTGVIRAHWNAISAGDFDAAFDLLSASYRARIDRSQWVADHENYSPRVYVRLVNFLQALRGGQAYVFADVFTRDTGSLGDSSVCNRFAGKVRVIKRGDAWRYVPDGGGDTFDKDDVLSRTDPNCRRLFG